ncbi:MAG: YkuS family protein [Bacillota bacterium]
MKKVIAVEAGLTPLEKLLRRDGYEVVSLAGNAWKHASAVVVSGMDSGEMNVQDVKTRAPVINAAGRSPEEVMEEVRRRTL